MILDLGVKLNFLAMDSKHPTGAFMIRIHHRFSSIAILLGIVFIYGLGRILSYFIEMNMYNLKSNK